jgi:hypothetical protein
MNLIHIYLIFFTFGILYTSTGSILKIRNKNLIRKHLSRNELIQLQKMNEDIEAYCFVNMGGAVYDLNPLNDPKEDYSVITADKKNSFYFNFCQFAVTTCKKNKSYAVLTRDTVIDNKSSDCSLLSASNKKTAPKWKIISKTYIYTIIIII